MAGGTVQRMLWRLAINSAILAATVLVGCGRYVPAPDVQDVGVAFDGRPGEPLDLPRRADVLTGWVKDRIGKSIPGVQIEAIKLPPPCQIPIVARTTSDRRGRFEIPFDAGEDPECLVCVEHEGFAIWEEFLSVSSSPVAIVLIPGRCVRFRLVDDFGVPCNDARITGKMTGNHFVFSPDGTGSFRVAIPKDEADIEIDVLGVFHPFIKKHLDWPSHGDPDLGEMVITEKY